MNPTEKSITKRIMKYLDSLPDAWFYKTHGGGFGKAGIPDIIGHYRGQFYAFEVKRPQFGKLSALQARTMGEINVSGRGLGYALAHLVTSKEDVEAVLTIPGMK